MFRGLTAATEAGLEMFGGWTAEAGLDMLGGLVAESGLETLKSWDSYSITGGNTGNTIQDVWTLETISH